MLFCLFNWWSLTQGMQVFILNMALTWIVLSVKDIFNFFKTNGWSFPWRTLHKFQIIKHLIYVNEQSGNFKVSFPQPSSQCATVLQLQDTVINKGFLVPAPHSLLDVQEQQRKTTGIFWSDKYVPVQTIVQWGRFFFLIYVMCINI